MAILEHAELLRILHYEPVTGDFRWRVKHSVKVVPGRIAGCLNRSIGYWIIGIDGANYYAHRLAWFYMTGAWPKQIDHRDGDRLNNKWENLRLATHSQNVLNAKRAKNNTSGFKGVSWHEGAKRWMASAYLNGKSNYLGLFDDPEEGHRAYLAAVEAAQPEFVRSK